MTAHAHTYTARPSLQALFDRTLAQVREGAQSAPLPVEAPRPVAQALRPQPMPEAPQRPAQRPTARPTEAVPARVLPTLPTAAALRAGLKLGRGLARAHDLLVRFAGDMARHRAHAVLPDAVTFHIPAVGLAALLGYHPDHMTRLAKTLKALGLIDFGAHAQNVAGRPMWDGTIWKVSLTPGHRPSIRRDEWKHDWRPDFAADYTGKKGVKAEMSGLLTQEGEAREAKETAYQALKARAAVQVTEKSPVASSPDIFRARGLDGLPDRVRALAQVHAAHRPQAITDTALALAAALGEPERRAQWAGQLWAAFRAEWEDRAGLDGLALALERLRADLAEGAPWRRPGALLASRLA